MLTQKKNVKKKKHLNTFQERNLPVLSLSLSLLLNLPSINLKLFSLNFRFPSLIFLSLTILSVTLSLIVHIVNLLRFLRSLDNICLSRAFAILLPLKISILSFSNICFFSIFTLYYYPFPHTFPLSFLLKFIYSCLFFSPSPNAICLSDSFFRFAFFLRFSLFHRFLLLSSINLFPLTAVLSLFLLFLLLILIISFSFSLSFLTIGQNNLPCSFFLSHFSSIKITLVIEISLIFSFLIIFFHDSFSPVSLNISFVPSDFLQLQRSLVFSFLFLTNYTISFIFSIFISLSIVSTHHYFFSHFSIFLFYHFLPCSNHSLTFLHSIFHSAPLFEIINHSFLLLDLLSLFPLIFTFSFSIALKDFSFLFLSNTLLFFLASMNPRA
ncbi:unnamed protein product [Acanthosepion pharaonis]|uniref:Uncharacterized protein n=1 Tax=Acanthosepion pharaonis TaxID=158019 RepID=A0A812E0S2_ACAPH|nr:unnamed protein product [Sepia pharaonis]